MTYDYHDQNKKNKPVEEWFDENLYNKFGNFERFETKAEQEWGDVHIIGEAIFEEKIIHEIWQNFFFEVVSNSNTNSPGWSLKFKEHPTITNRYLIYRYPDRYYILKHKELIEWWMGYDREQFYLDKSADSGYYGSHGRLVPCSLPELQQFIVGVKYVKTN
jgi:hypothetical protein